MSIELHCPQCGKLIRAPENAGGKRGKCPYCERNVYIPTPVAAEEIIPLAPMNPDEEAHEAELRRESTRYAASIEHATEAGVPPSGRGGAKPSPSPPIDIRAEILSFVRAMRDSRLDEAERMADRLIRAGARARDQIDQMIFDEVPPTVENVPPPVLKGFLKSLRARFE